MSCTGNILSTEKLSAGYHESGKQYHGYPVAPCVQFLGSFNPANPIITRKLRNVLPLCQRSSVSSKVFLQIGWDTVCHTRSDFSFGRPNFSEKFAITYNFVHLPPLSFFSHHFELFSMEKTESVAGKCLLDCKT